jgi:type IV pilus assembly protein PilE
MIAPRDRSGFSLIELLVALAAVAIIAGIAVPAWQSQRARAERSDARAWLIRLGNDQQAHFVRTGRYATDLRELGFATATAPTPNGRYTLAVAATSATGFTMRATRIPADREARKCTWLALDQAQSRMSGPASPDECWWR